MGDRMKNINSDRDTKYGFTLAELLTVVAVIGILVAVSIPIFTSQLKKTNEAVCQANRRALKGVLATMLITDEDNLLVSVDEPNTEIESYKEFMAQYICPSGGTIKYRIDHTKNIIEVYCNKHTTLNGTILQDAEKIITENNLWVGIDSTAIGTETNREKLEKLFKAANIDLKALGIKAWSVGKSDKVIEFTTSDITKMKAGDKITIIRCRFDYKPDGSTKTYELFYSVWEAEVKIGNREDDDKTMREYNVIGTKTKQLTDNTNGKQETIDQKTNIEEIKKIYNDNCGDAEKMN